MLPLIALVVDHSALPQVREADLLGSTSRAALVARDRTHSTHGILTLSMADAMPADTVLLDATAAAAVEAGDAAAGDNGGAPNGAVGNPVPTSAAAVPGIEDAPPPPPEAPPPPADWRVRVDPSVLEQILDGRRRPGWHPGLPEAVTQDNPGAIRVLPPSAFPSDTLPIPDRWRLVTAFCPVQSIYVAIQNVCHSPLDPYHQNRFKGDRPLNLSGVPRFIPFRGDDWFLTLTAVSDTVVEPRTFPIPVGVQTTERPGSINVFGKPDSLVLSQTFIAGVALTKGMTAFKPPDVEYRVALAFNMNYVDVPERRVLFVEPSKPTHRYDHFLGVQEAFIDKHLGNDSDRYDFHSIRIGIQPFQADFRGFLFNDNQLGVRIFGNRDNNRFQYNLAAFWRLEKDTNSGLNNVTQTPRRDWVFVANLYRQDFPVPALTSQITVVYNRNREANRIHIDSNGFPVRPALLGVLRPRTYDVVYAGYSADGRIGRVNLTASFYGAFGRDDFNFLTDVSSEIRAFFGAAELSYDHDWMRFRLSALYATGAHFGFCDPKASLSLRKLNSPFQGHPHVLDLPWVETSTGSLGQGMSVAVGMAIGLRLQKIPARVYTMLGDGELQEGEVWEAAMSAAHHRLDNLCAVIDYNKLQSDNCNDAIMRLEPLADKWRAFGWSVAEIDGHNIPEILDQLRRAGATREKPSVLIAHTIKGKGVPYMENIPTWHGSVKLTRVQTEEALTALGASADEMKALLDV